MHDQGPGCTSLHALHLNYNTSRPEWILPFHHPACRIITRTNEEASSRLTDMIWGLLTAAPMRRLRSLLTFSLSSPSYRMIALDPSNSASIALAISALLLLIDCNTAQLTDLSLPSLLTFATKLEFLSDHRAGAQSNFLLKSTSRVRCARCARFKSFRRHELI